MADQSVVLMREVVNTKENTWIVQGTAGTGMAICVILVISQPDLLKYFRLPKSFQMFTGSQLAVSLFSLADLCCRSSA